jgi:hypothetical protein
VFAEQEHVRNNAVKNSPFL